MWGLARYTAPGSRERAERIGLKSLVGTIGSGDFSSVTDDFDYVMHFAADCDRQSMDQATVDNVEGSGLLMNHYRKAKAF